VKALCQPVAGATASNICRIKARATDARAYFIKENNQTTDKGKPGESRGRKTRGAKALRCHASQLPVG